jgi:hypothetical protein
VSSSDDAARQADAGHWLAEAFGSGQPLRSLPGDDAPRDRDAAEAIAGDLCEALGLAPAGLRLVLRDGAPPLAGPLLAERCLPQARPVSLSGLHHASATAALLGVLAAPLDPGSAAPPEFASLAPALDLAASRYTDGPADDLAAIADLAGLGLLVLGRAVRAAPGVERVTLAEGRTRPRGEERDLAAAFSAAAVEARRLGGLPAGGGLAIAGLSAPRAPLPGLVLSARLGALGAARVQLV